MRPMVSLGDPAWGLPLQEQQERCKLDPDPGARDLLGQGEQLGPCGVRGRQLQGWGSRAASRTRVTPNMSLYLVRLY